MSVQCRPDLARRPLLAMLECALTVGIFGCGSPEHLTAAPLLGGGGASGNGGTLAGTIGGAGTGSIEGGAGTPDAAADLGPTSHCGNGLIEIPESCDDSNAAAGDGCSNTCVTEPNYICATAGKPCTHVVVCGDHRIDGDETCDDNNTAGGDGCSAGCKLECGWECPPGASCRATRCGDGMVAGHEQCDDGNTVAGDGCSPICLLESRPAGEAEGWACTAPTAGGCVGPTVCAKTTCGNRLKEGSEQCDDGNAVPGDGCSPFCRLEPICPPADGACANPCGDGLVLQTGATTTDKECDDGNTVNGDGCSSTCKIEAGYACTGADVRVNPLILPIVYRDFQSWKDAGGHPDFEHYQGNGVAGMVQQTLTPNGVPAHVPMCVDWSSNLCMVPANVTPAWAPATDWFGMWYVDAPPYNKTVVQTLTLGGQVNGINSTTCNTPGQPACTSFQYSNEMFFPLDGVPGAWGNTPGASPAHDFGFTSVARYWFQYSGVATLTFVGDDDVWVFVNKKLAVDLGGTHQRATGNITLDHANGHGYACDFVAPGKAGGACDPVGKTGGHDVDLGLAIGSLYEIDVFQAERFPGESHYQLTLSNFSGKKSSCVSRCGDGVVTPPEVCDLGAMNTGAYGGCNPDCTLAPYCGDKSVQTVNGEECDSTPNCDNNCKKAVIQ